MSQKPCKCHPAKPTPAWALPWLQPPPRPKEWAFEEVVAEYEKVGAELEQDPGNKTLARKRDYIYDIYATLVSKGYDAAGHRLQEMAYEVIEDE